MVNRRPHWRRAVRRSIKRYGHIVLTFCVTISILTASIGFSCLLAPLWIVLLWHGFILYVGFRFALRASLFPGSLLVWKSSVEHSFKTQLSRYLASQIECLHDFIECISSNNSPQTRSRHCECSSANIGIQSCPHSTLLVAAAHAWISIQTVESTLAFQQLPSSVSTSTERCSSSSPSVTSIESLEVHPLTSTSQTIAHHCPRCQYSVVPISHESSVTTTTTTTTTPGDVERPKRHSLSVIASTLLSITISHLLPRRRDRYQFLELFRCLRFRPMTFATSLPADHSLFTALQHMFLKMNNCLISIPAAFGAPGDFKRLLHPSCVKEETVDVVTKGTEEFPHRKPFQVTRRQRSVSLQDVCERMTWALGPFLTEVYFRHLALFCSEASVEDNQVKTRAVTLCRGIKDNEFQKLIILLEEIHGETIPKETESGHCNIGIGVPTVIGTPTAPHRQKCLDDKESPSLGVLSGTCRRHDVERTCTSSLSVLTNSQRTVVSSSQLLLKELQSTMDTLLPLYESCGRPFSLRQCPSLMSDFLLEPPVGSLTHLRNELVVKHDGINFWIFTRDGYKIDAMFLPMRSNRTKEALCDIRRRITSDARFYEFTSNGTAFSSESSAQSHLQSKCSQFRDHPFPTSDDAPSLRNNDCVNSCQVSPRASTEWRWGPVVVFCSPNASFYETTMYHDDWLDFYRTRNANFVVFNYRGFGRSEGCPSPTCVAEDTEDLVSFLLAPYNPASVHQKIAHSTFGPYSTGCGITRLGLHGRSIGGVAAVHAAWKFGDRVKWLCADRAFCSLEATAFHLMGSWSLLALRLGAISVDNVKKYLECRAYKVLCWDPDDQVIANAASLKSGTCKAVISSPQSSTTSCSPNLELSLITESSELVYGQTTQHSNQRSNQSFEDLNSLELSSLMKV